MDKNVKKIETKNYIILAVVLVVTVIAVFYARSWYLETKSVTVNSSQMLEVVKEIHQEELENYTLENPRFILYVASSQDKSISEFEKELKRMIISEELENYFLYLNSDEIQKSKLNKTLIEMAKNASVRKDISNADEVSLYIVETGRITKVISNAEKLSAPEIRNTLTKYGVIDNA